MQKVFSEKLDIKLIKLVKENPVLYDYNDAKYMDFNAREVAWQKIGDGLEKPAADCKVRWINIRDVHRRILRKSMVGPRPPKRAYKYDKHLDFMKNFYKEAVAVDTEENSENENVDRSSETNSSAAWNDVGLEFENDGCSSDDGDNKPLRKRKKAAKPSNKPERFEEVQMPVSIVNEPQELDTTDPVDAFLMSIGATLKRFSPYHLNLAKSKIFHVVQEHDLQQIVERQPRSETITITTESPVYYQG